MIECPLAAFTAQEHRQWCLNQSKSFANLAEREKELKVEGIYKEVVLDDERLNG